MLSRIVIPALGLVFLAEAVLAAAEPAGPVVRIDATPRQQVTYGMDFERLWYWNGVKDKASLARLAVRDCPVDYVRVAISCGAELQEGKVDWGAYNQILEVMRVLRTARPDIKFFASQQPIHNVMKTDIYTCYPLWIMIYDDENKFVEFKWDKAADFLVRYLGFMREQGFAIDYMDIKNEVRHIRPAAAAKMIERVRARVGDDKMPDVIAPSSYNYKRAAQWLEEAIETGHTNFFDIVSTHNTKEAGSAARVADLARELGKPAWNTEVHFWHGPDDVAVENQRFLFTLLRAGFSGFNEWLSLGNAKKEGSMFRCINGEIVPMRTYHIYRHLVRTSVGGNYLASACPADLTSTIAFRREGLMTIWALNTNDAATAEIMFETSGPGFESDEVSLTWWGSDNGREGTSTTLKTINSRTLSHAVPGRTLCCYALSVKP